MPRRLVKWTNFIINRENWIGALRSAYVAKGEMDLSVQKVSTYSIFSGMVSDVGIFRQRQCK